jgi:uroporphyrinogen-III synthase
VNGGPGVLITRPEPQARALATALAAEGWWPILWPLMTVAPLATPDLGGAQAVLLTSANAARLTPAAPIPALCVGAATARAAREAGFADVRSADGDAAALAALARATLDPSAGPLAFVRGETVAGDLAGALRAAGFDVTEHVAYAARPALAAPAAVATALDRGAVAAALFYSPRTAEIFADLCSGWRDALARTTAVAISDAAAAPLAALGFAAVRVAARPDDAAMRDALAATRPKKRDD